MAFQYFHIYCGGQEPVAVLKRSDDEKRVKVQQAGGAPYWVRAEYVIRKAVRP